MTKHVTWLVRKVDVCVCGGLHHINVVLTSTEAPLCETRTNEKNWNQHLTLCLESLGSLRHWATKTSVAVVDEVQTAELQMQHIV